MQDGAASLLSRHLSASPQNSPLAPTARAVLDGAFKHLTVRDESAWTSGQCKEHWLSYFTLPAVKSPFAYSYSFTPDTFPESNFYSPCS
jgi:hypothetical protein